MSPPRLPRAGDVAALGCGAALPLAFAPFNWFPLAVLCVAGLMLLMEGQPSRTAARRGFLFGFAAFLGGTYWLYISLHGYGKAPLAVALPLMIALVAIMALYTLALGLVAGRLLPRAGARRWLLGLPAAWTLLEWLRGWLFSGFPWLSLGYSQIDAPLAALAPVAGVFAVGWAVALSAGCIVALVHGSTRTRIAALGAAALVWGAALAAGTAAWTEPAGPPLRVAILQGGISQDRKWLPDELEPTKAWYRQTSLAHRDADLIIWPEAAIPALMHELDDFFGALLEKLRADDTALATGIVRFDFETRHFFNSVLVADRSLQFYDKRHLVPFGEYFPVPDVVRGWMRLMSLPYTDYAAGARDQPPLAMRGVRLGVSICYEDVFGEELLDVLPEAGLLINVSNDAWFGGSIAPHQHLQIARMRALEAGRYLLRATNTGISAVIAADGSLEQTSPQFEQHVLRAHVQPYARATPYARSGNVPVVAGAFLLLAAALAPRRTSRDQG